MAKAMLLLLACVSFLAACGQGDEAGNQPPVADAGPDQVPPDVSVGFAPLLRVRVGDTVLLDGSASSDPDGDALAYTWSFEAFPADSEAALADPATADASFIADKAGDYVARLTVNDGSADSAPDTVLITAVVPPPTVAISSPEHLSVLNAPAVTLSGTVDDSSATLTVNKSFNVANNGGTYATPLTLVEGGNTVLVVGQNTTGTGSASVTVLLDTSSNPAVTLTTPGGDFIQSAGQFAMGVPFPASSLFHARGVIKVNTLSAGAAGNQPSASVNGVAADVFQENFTSACSQPDLFQCWGFTAAVPLARGNNTLDAIGTDVQTRSTTDRRVGVTDYCRIGAYDPKQSTPGHADPGVHALAGPNSSIQNNRCHEIDGCSAPDVSQQCADDPMQCPEGGGGTVLKKVRVGWAVAIPATHQQGTTRFGQGAAPPSEHFIHGFASAHDVPCNRHDACYQTCVPAGGTAEDIERALEAAWHACNAAQRREMLDVCNRAYPARCPYRVTILGRDLPDPAECPRYSRERTSCTLLAKIYYQGVESAYAPGSFLENQLGGQPSGFTRFKQRQRDYCLS